MMVECYYTTTTKMHLYVLRMDNKKSLKMTWALQKLQQNIEDVIKQNHGFFRKYMIIERKGGKKVL